MNCTPVSLAALICVVFSRTVALTCLSCRDSVRPRDCEYVQECGSHEKCSIESYLTTNGYIIYNVGCMDGLRCASAGRKRAVLNATLLNKIQQTNDFGSVLEEHEDPNDVLLCTECCGTELCNIKGCGEQGLPPNSGPLCYACEQESAPNKCNKITPCGADNSCRLSMRRVGVDFVYKSDCVHTYECEQLGVLDIGAYQLVGRRDADVISRFERSATCNKCCSKNLCNSDNCTSLTYPPTTFLAPTLTTPATTTLAPVNGGWSTWSHWNICSLTCGGGQHYRVRVCDNPTPANGAALCSGSKMETQACNDQPCTVDGSWSHWGNWFACTATCGSSVTRSRSRTCTNPAPSTGGANCMGTASDAESCNLGECPVDGNWSDWGHWSACIATCGSSVTRSRSRTCTNPAPSTGGANCMGTASAAESCNLGACPGSCTDKISNCNSYDTGVCSNPAYTQWVTENCGLYCGKCGSCTDKISNCNSFGPGVCSNPAYTQWVTENCGLYCGKCGSPSTGTGVYPGQQPGNSGTGMGTGTGAIDLFGNCADTITNCAAYGSSVCTDASYSSWVTNYCAKSCNKCCAQIIRSVQNFTKPMGSRIVIDCLLLGSAPPEQVPKVIWSAPQIIGQPLPSNVVELRNGSIFIDGLTLANVGAYSCTFNNECGTHHSANFWVNIQ